MANRHQGEASFEFEKRKYTLALTSYAWALAQDELTKGDDVPTIDEIGKRLRKRHILSAYVVFWAMLQKHHPEIATTPMAAELLESCGAPAGDAMLLALQRAQADPEDVAELSEGANPQKAQAVRRKKAGGDVFSSMHAKSA